MKRVLRTIILLLLVFLPRSRELRVAFIGDSITYGGAVQPEESYTYLVSRWLGCRAFVLGVPGATAPEVALMTSEVEGFRPDLVVVYFGTNDVKHIHAGTESWKEYADALRALAALAPRAILVTPHRGVEFPERRYFLSYVEEAASVVQSLDYPVADVYSICCEKEEMADYAHPNREGHAIVASEIERVIASLDRK